ncbi:hypothetical protein BHE74_00044567 [Ensete ventricosum]|nr:hypothetical protein BHE74_00044567 [Ensete ventricosum]
MVELGSGGSIPAWVGRRLLQEGRRSGRVGSRRDPSDGQVSSVVDFAIPLLRGGAGAFIVTVTGYPYLNPLTSLLLIVPLLLTMPSVVLAARRASAALCAVEGQVHNFLYRCRRHPQLPLPLLPPAAASSTVTVTLSFSTFHHW